MPTAIDQLLEIMRRLRDPETGCPWDREQTFATIAPYTIEEAYEVVDAIRRGNHGDLQHELGDLLLQVVYHARIAEEQGLFNFSDVVQSISDKMVRRHPHVFGTGERPQQFGVMDWERQKQQERTNAKRSALDGAADANAPMDRAVTLGQRAARVGFDWPDTNGVYEKIKEELAELLVANDREQQREEFGDLLFTLMNLARHLQLNPESALRHASKKFTARFRAMEELIANDGKNPATLDLESLESYWQRAKQQPSIRDS